MPRKKPPSPPKAEEIPGLRAYLSTIGKAGGEASGASRRLAREKLDAGSMSEEERWAYEMRREQARQAARARWSKVKPGE